MNQTMTRMEPTMMIMILIDLSLLFGALGRVKRAKTKMKETVFLYD